MSNTPRMDAIFLKYARKEITATQTREECDKIERELAEARAEIERKDKLIEQMRVALAWLYQWTKNEIEHFDANTPDDEIIKDVEAALSAAEMGK